jgi:UDP-glucose 4-epimerase
MDMVGVYTEVLIRWLDAIEAHIRPLIFGDGMQSMDFVYVEDVARANILAAQSDVTDHAFNVGTGTSVTLNELCAILLNITGSPLKPEYREARKVANVQRRCAATEKAERILGFKATTTLEQGLRQIIPWRQARKAVEAAVVEA